MYCVVWCRGCCCSFFKHLYFWLNLVVMNGTFDVTQLHQIDIRMSGEFICVDILSMISTISIFIFKRWCHGVGQGEMSELLVYFVKWCKGNNIKFGIQNYAIQSGIFSGYMTQKGYVLICLNFVLKVCSIYIVLIEIYMRFRGQGIGQG